MKTIMIKQQIRQLEQGIRTVERKLGEVVYDEYMLGAPRVSPERVAFYEVTLGDLTREASSLRRAMKALH